jgi:hypothetical protein
MKISFSRSVLLALGLACGYAYEARAAEPYAAPSLLPIPAIGQETTVQQTAFKRFQAEEVGPSIAPGQPGQQLPPPPAATEPVSPYEAARGGAWADDGYGGYSDGGCADGSCADVYGCNPCGYGCSTWWASTAFLWFGRDREDFKQLSFDDTDVVGSVLNTDSANMNFSPGFQASIGRWFCGGTWGIEATYWGIFAQNQENTVLASQINGNLNTVFDFQPLNIGATNVNSLYDAAQAHRVRRSWEFHNIELNFLQGAGYNWNYGYNNAFNVGLIAGVRYFRFSEGFQYASADQNPVFGADPANEAYYDIDVQNHLVGVQIGANATYNVGQRVRLRATPKAGVFNNHIHQIQRIYNANGVATVGVGNPLAGQAYDINTEKDDVSFLTEIDLGLDWRISQRWSATVGYRAVAITGVALATHQIPSNFADIPGARDIDNDQSIILHGGYAGITYMW